MEKAKKILKIAIKRLLLFLLPIVLLLYVFYGVILGYDLSSSLREVALYVVLITIMTIGHYTEKIKEEKIENNNWLLAIKEENRWRVLKEDAKGLVLRPRFDFPYNLLAKETVKVNYSGDTATLVGPRYYVDQLTRDIQGRSNKWVTRFATVGTFIFVIIILSIPIIFNSGIQWDLKIKYHNYQMRDVQKIEIQDSYAVGNTVSNSNNYGSAAETEDYLFYVEDHLNLVKTDKNFNNKEYLIEKGSGNGIGSLNIVEDWIFYSSKSFNRIKLDGTENTTLYELSYLMEPQVVGNWIYFINYQDNFSVYRMDVNGQNLERFIEKDVMDLGVYDDRLFYSGLKDKKYFVESIDFDGKNRRLEFEADSLVRDFTRWNNEWYYINGDSRLIRTEGKDPDVYQVPIDDNVHSYIITEQGIFYSLQGEEEYISQGIYKMDHIGYNKILLSHEKNVEGFAHIGEWLLYSSFNEKMFTRLKRVDLNTGEIEIVE